MNIYILILAFFFIKLFMQPHATVQIKYELVWIVFIEYVEKVAKRACVHTTVEEKKGFKQTKKIKITTNYSN